MKEIVSKQKIEELRSLYLTRPAPIYSYMSTTMISPPPIEKSFADVVCIQRTDLIKYLESHEELRMLLGKAARMAQDRGDEHGKNADWEHAKNGPSEEYKRARERQLEAYLISEEIKVIGKDA